MNWQKSSYSRAFRQRGEVASVPGAMLVRRPQEPRGAIHAFGCQPPAFGVSPELGRCRILHGGELGFLGSVPGGG